MLKKKHLRYDVINFYKYNVELVVQKWMILFNRKHK
jgi:hypothetical protein